MPSHRMNRHRYAITLAGVASLLLGMAGCSTCREPVTLSITNASSKAVRVTVSPRDPEMRESMALVIPPGGVLQREPFTCECGLAPMLLASTLDPSPVNFETELGGGKGAVRLVDTPSGGIGVEVAPPTAPPSEPAAQGGGQ